MVKICEECREPFEPEYEKSKAKFCSDTCRIRHHRKAKNPKIRAKAPQKSNKMPAPKPKATPPIKGKEGMSLEQFKAILLTHENREAIKEICREILGPDIRRISPEPPIIPEGDSYTYTEIVNPNADITKQMVAPKPGTLAYYMRNGVWGDGRDIPT
jgi:hypothetical protein